MATQSPQFSIITAHLDRTVELDQLRECLLRQTFKDWEWIIQDGGTAGLKLDQSYTEDKRIKLICEADSGIADALNRGLKRATGKWICIIQADDRFTDDKTLERLDDVLADQKTVYSFPVHLIGESGKIRKLYPSKKPGGFPFKLPFPHQGLIVSKDKYNEIGHFDCALKIAFDFDWEYRLLHSHTEIQILEDDYFQMKEGGVSTRKDWSTRKTRWEEEQEVRLRFASTIVRKLSLRIIFPIYLIYRF